MISSYLPMEKEQKFIAVITKTITGVKQHNSYLSIDDTSCTFGLTVKTVLSNSQLYLKNKFGLTHFV